MKAKLVAMGQSSHTGASSSSSAIPVKQETPDEYTGDVETDLDNSDAAV